MVQTIDIEVVLNLIIFAMFFTIASTELMAASAIIFKYKESEKKVFKFLIPIWEVTGTFFVFYVVNLEGLMPDVLPLLAYSFISYILILLILYVLRNTLIISAENLWKRKNRIINRRLLYSAYAIVTFVLGAMIVMIYAAFIGGHGLNFNAETFNLISFITFLPDDGFIIGIAILFFGLAAVYYGLDVNPFLPFIVTTMGMLLSGISIFEMGDTNNSTLFIIPIIFTLSIPLLWMFNKTKNIAENKLVFQGLLSISIFFLAYSQYPYLLGKNLLITSVLNNSAMQTQMFYATLIGGAILLVLTYFFFDIYFGNSQNENQEPIAEGEN
jgi:cytochrome d ubiquinol oxidase subunit II